jgi:hypothetical protein
MNLKKAPIYPRHTDVHDFEWFERSVELMGTLLLNSLYYTCVAIGLAIAYFCGHDNPPNHS